MNNVVIIPIILPVIAGLIMIMMKDKIRLQRALSLAVMLALLIVTIGLMNEIKESGIQTLQLGGWEAPFGISLVADMFSSLLVLAASVVAFCALLYAFPSITEERERHYFYPFFLFLIAGVNGSFLTGDIFNLFVMFEVMLVASYALISLGGTKAQMKASIKYVLVNLVSSFLFLVAIAYLYAVVGTLNLAHLSIRISEVGLDGLMITVAIVFLIVFGIKAGLFLFFWLPDSYSGPPTAIAAIFAALLTKVGIYAIIRVFSVIFYQQPEITHFFIGILAAATMILGALGAVAYWDIKRILTYNVIVGVGLVLAGFASFTYEGMIGSTYYLIHDIIIKCLIFLLGGTIIHLTGTSKIKEISGLIRLHPQFGWMFFIAALSLAGIPPLSGFIGKVFITEGAFEAGYFWLGAVGIITSLMVLYSVIKIFLHCFWGYTDLTEETEKGSIKGLLFPIGILTALTIALGLGAEGIHPYVDIAVTGILDPNVYIEAVLGKTSLP